MDDVQRRIWEHYCKRLTVDELEKLLRAFETVQVQQQWGRTFEPHELLTEVFKSVFNCSEEEAEEKADSLMTEIGNGGGGDLRRFMD
jgi:hypothetical protein